MSKDDLGDRMKAYEGTYTNILLPDNQHVYARIDGRGFSRLTRNLQRPFDSNFHACMIATTAYLVEQTHAMAGFTQSDEISLIWNKPDWFSGKTLKMSSVLAGMASSKFMSALYKSQDTSGTMQKLTEKMPHFDARVFSVPTLEELANAMLWRVLDCEKNSVSMLAHSHFSHKSLQGKNSLEMKQQLVEIDDPIEAYPKSFVHGTWVRRRLVQRPLTPDELEKIPRQHRPDPNELVTRHETVYGAYPKFKTLLIDQKIAWLTECGDMAQYYNINKQGTIDYVLK